MLQYVIDPEDSINRTDLVYSLLDEYFYENRWFQYISDSDLLSILTESPICKVSPPDKYSTVAFFQFTPGFDLGVFGVGNLRDMSHGIFPF